MKDLLKNRTLLAGIAGALLGLIGGVTQGTAPVGALCPCDGIVMVPPLPCPVLVEQPCDATNGAD